MKRLKKIADIYFTIEKKGHQFLDEKLVKKDIEKIVEAFEGYQDIEKYARVVNVKELEENEFNLNVRRYVENGEDEEIVDVKTVWNEVQEIEKARTAIDKKVEKFIKELKY